MEDTSLTLAVECSNPIGDVVFLHGLGGNGTQTWMSEGKVKSGEATNKYESFFPAILAADFPKAAFWTLDYSAEMTKWSENLDWNELQRVCAGILEYLIGMGIGRRPLVLVCHSLGGIVAKEVLRHSMESKTKRLNTLYENLKGVSFLATPHKGSKWANILQSVNVVLPFVRPTTRIDELEFDSVYLEKLSKWYRENIITDRAETQAFYEQKKTKGIMVVSHVSANPDVSGCDPIPVSSNHISICKPKDKKAIVYVSLSSLIRFHLYNDLVLSEDPSIDQVLPLQTVVIGLVVRKHEVLMVRRRNMISRLTWQFVAGRLKVGEEDPGECIVREIHEETGIDAKPLEKLGEEDPGDTPYKRIYFACEYLAGEPTNNDPNENSDAKWVPIDKVDTHVTSTISQPVRDYLDKFQ